MVVNMKEKKDGGIEELAEELEARLTRQEEDDLEEIVLDAWDEGSSEKEIPGMRRTAELPEDELSEDDREEDGCPEDEWEEGKYREVSRGKGRYPEARRGKGKYPEEAREGNQYPEGRRGKGKYPEEAREEARYPEARRGKGKYPEEAREGNQYPEARRGKGRYPEEAREEARYPEARRGKDRYPEDDREEDGYPEASWGKGRYPKKDQGEDKPADKYREKKSHLKESRGSDKGSEDDWEEMMDPEDWEEEEDAPMKPWMMAAILAGLIVLAAIICAILWHFTHLGKEGEDSSSPSSAVSAEDAGSEAPSGTEPDNGALSGSAQTSEPVSSPEVTPAPQMPSTAAPPSSAAPTAAPGASQTAAPSGAQASAAVQEPVSGTRAMEFTQSSDEVTPKDVVNLRSEPSTLDADNIVVQAKNGEVLSRTGVNASTGWTRIDYNGETLYAVSQYLTTDLTYKTPVQAADPNRVSTLDGRIILFTDCSDNITPKEYVNLRTEPSTSEGENTVRCQISNGEVVHRTGYSPDAGWSRVEYNGEILYVVSSYMYTVE